MKITTGRAETIERRFFYQVAPQVFYCRETAETAIVDGDEAVIVSGDHAEEIEYDIEFHMARVVDQIVAERARRQLNQ